MMHERKAHQQQQREAAEAAGGGGMPEGADSDDEFYDAEDQGESDEETEIIIGGPSLDHFVTECVFLRVFRSCRETTNIIDRV